MGEINRQRLKSMVGKHVYIITKQGQMVDGILHETSGDKLYLRRADSKRQMAHTQAFFGANPFIPLVLFDLLAIGTLPFGFGFPFV